MAYAWRISGLAVASLSASRTIESRTRPTWMLLAATYATTLPWLAFALLSGRSHDTTDLAFSLGIVFAVTCAAAVRLFLAMRSGILARAKWSFVIVVALFVAYAGWRVPL